MSCWRSGQLCFSVRGVAYFVLVDMLIFLSYEPRYEKTGLRGFRPGPKADCIATEDGKRHQIS